MEDGNVAVLVDAKEEYTKQLVSILKPCIYQGVKSIYIDAKDICHQDNTPDNVLMVFQDLLSRIPKWSQDIITKEYDRISSVSKCDYIDDLLKVVYVSHIKVLTIVHSAQRNKKISIKVPSGSHFIHLCYIECAREFWKDPYLFSDRVSKYEHQKNMRDSETMISECISETIRKQLPVRHILKEFLNEPDEEIEEEDEDIKDPVNKKYLKKLETVVKKELKTSNKGIELDMELIRKVIREEMDSRSSTTKISETSVIKKELVDTVVEKIVEQSNIESVENIPKENTLPELTISKTIPIDTTVTDIATATATAIDTATDTATSTTTTTTQIEAIPTDIPTDITTTINTKQSEATDIATSTTKEPIQLDNENILNISIPESSTVEIITNPSSDVNTTEINGESLNNLLDNSDTNANTNANTNTNTNIVDIKMDSVKDEIAHRTNEVDMNNKPLPHLVINNIDEVNLNLDELDNELGDELDLNSLQTIDIKSSGKEVKKDANTKYIFFKDV